MAKTKHTVASNKRSSGSNKPSPARTEKGHRRSESNNGSPMKRVTVMEQFSEVLGQIQFRLGSLDRAIKSQGEKQVEIEHRIDRKRGSEINGSYIVSFFYYIVADCTFFVTDDEGAKKKRGKIESPTSFG
jgi:hypothetical protein